MHAACECDRCPQCGRRILLLQVRNKQMSKRETEKMVKEIWKDKLHEMRAGKQTDLVDFVFQHLHKRVGIITAVVEVRLAFQLSGFRV